MSDPRSGHPPRHHPTHPSASYPSLTAAAYATANPSHPSFRHPHSRHVSAGMPPSGPLPMGAMPDAIGPIPSVLSNGHGHHLSANLINAHPAARQAKEKMDDIMAQLSTASENTWMLIGAVAEQMQDQDRALAAFENALRLNPSSILALNAVAAIARGREHFDRAIEYFQRILNIKQDNGEVWGSMGHCLLMKDDLPKAYTAYQQALYHLPNPKEPKLWYGIGILYDRYGSFEHAEEAFSSVLKMDPNFEKANEIYFRLGIIYKHQRKYSSSLECFRYIINNPPRPLTSWDIWFQLGHVYEQDRDYEAARDAYLRVLTHQPDHAKVLQQLGWLHHQPGAPFADQDKAVQYLTKSLETDGSDAQSWYLLGRAFMAGQRYNKAYEAYQQAVYRDGRNPTFWCSIGVLYYQINQYRDALDAYSRAIRLNPYISEVWYNLGSLYESCNNQITDAIDAYTRAAGLDPANATIKLRLSMLQNAGATNAPLPPAPGPVDVHPSQYTATPAGFPGGSPGGSPRGITGTSVPSDARSNDPGALDLPLPPADFARGHSPGPFRGGGAAPPPLQHVDESRGAMSRHAPLAPIETVPEPRDARIDSGLRYDPTLEQRANGSPRRRTDHSALPNHSLSHRDREREEWESSRGGPRYPEGPPVDPRGPSLRVPDRASYPPTEPRRQPSPSIPPEYRGEHERPGEASYPNQAGRGHLAHERSYELRRDEARRPEERGEVKQSREPTPNGNLHHYSVSRDMRTENPRATSPALSTASKTTKRKYERQDKHDNKRATEEKVPGKRSSGDKRKDGGSLKVTLHRPIQPDDERSTPPAGPSTNPHRSNVLSMPQQLAAPNRSVDEDYDEGAADALMTLHGDHHPTPNGSAVSPGRSNSGGSLGLGISGATNKRPEPPSPESPQSSKKARADASPKSATRSAVDKRTVIEVLNTPRITSPVPRLDNATVETREAEPSKSLASGSQEREDTRDAAVEIDAAAVLPESLVAKPDDTGASPSALQSIVQPAVTPPSVHELVGTTESGADSGDLRIEPAQSEVVAAATSEAAVATDLSGEESADKADGDADVVMAMAETGLVTEQTIAA